MRIVPLSKHEYRVFPIADNEPYIEITSAEYDGLEAFEKCFSDDLSKVIDYIKSETELRYEAVEQKKAMLVSQIIKLKEKLRESDYKALKYIEGELTAEEYAETKERRREWRKSINDLETQIEREQE